MTKVTASTERVKYVISTVSPNFSTLHFCTFTLIDMVSILAYLQTSFKLQSNLLLREKRM